MSSTHHRRAAARLLPWVAVLLLVAGLVAMASHNLGYTGMWWDESASFWNSQGVSRYAEPFAARRGWRDVVRMNRVENLDPGGHSLLLHFWTAAGTSPEILRSLSLVFLLVACTALGTLGLLLTRSPAFAVAAAATPLLFPSVRYFAFEIRAYSMEMAGVAVLALLVALAADRPTRLRLVLLGFGGAAFLTSRYSFALVVAAACLALAGAWLQRNDDPKVVISRLAAAGLPVTAVGAVIVRVTLRDQLWPEMLTATLGLKAPAYTHGAVLSTVADPLALLRTNLLAPTALPITIAVVLYLVGRRTRGRVPPAVAALYLLVLAVQAISAAASATGAYPWDLRSRWSTYLVMVAAVAAVTVAADLVVTARSRLALMTPAPGIWRLAPRAGTAAAVLVVAVAASAGASHRQAAVAPYRADVAGQVDLLPANSLADRSVLVTYYEVPVVRFLYEHGPYRGRSEYPRAFLLEDLSDYWKQPEIDAARDGIRFVVSGRLLAELQARFPGAVLAPVDPAGSRLLAVAPAAPGQPSARAEADR